MEMSGHQAQPNSPLRGRRTWRRRTRDVAAVGAAHGPRTLSTGRPSGRVPATLVGVAPLRGGPTPSDRIYVDHS